MFHTQIRMYSQYEKPYNLNSITSHHYIIQTELKLQIIKLFSVI
jgi:hypothetical protein